MVHTGEVLFVDEYDGGADHLSNELPAASRIAEMFLRALRGFFLDGAAYLLTGGWVVRACSGGEDQKAARTA